MGRSYRVRLLVAAIAVFVGGMAWMAIAQAVVPADLKVKFELLNDEPPMHERGKVKLFEFADFYCPHCHHFEETGLTILQKEFGNRLEANMVGFPVFHNKLPTPFDMYEQAKMMGKGKEMKQVLFRTIHKDKMTGVLDRSIRELLIREVGLDPRPLKMDLPVEN